MYYSHYSRCKRGFNKATRLVDADLATLTISGQNNEIFLNMNRSNSMIQAMRKAAGTIKIGISEISIRAPTEIKNMRQTYPLGGSVTILATDVLLDSATNTPAGKAPVATDKA
jgi:hypothetical protein